jgi:hypothetical protein
LALSRSTPFVVRNRWRSGAGSPLGKVLEQFGPQGIDRGPVGSFEQRAKTTVEFLLHRFGGGIEDIPRQMRLAPLPTGPLELLFDSLLQLAVTIRDNECDAR